jgi:hypothetical protein
MKPNPLHTLTLLLLSAGELVLAQAEPCFLLSSASEKYTCTCGPGPHQFPIGGTGTYTGDSHICTAAVHAGVISQDGGEVTVLRVEPPSEFRGSTAHGVISRGIRAPQGSAYVFAGAEEVEALPSCGLLAEETELACYCESGRPRGHVWGSGPYRADSDICTAARHAGIVGQYGGEVRLQRAPGQESYPGGTANGVTTSEAGSADASFTLAPNE